MKRNDFSSDPFKTLLVILLGLLFIYLKTGNKPLLIAALALGGISFLFPLIASLIERIWFTLAEWLGLIVPNIVLFVIFFFILTPIAFMSRIFKSKDEMNLVNDKASLFVNADKPFDVSFFRKTW